MYFTPSLVRALLPCCDLRASSNQPANQTGVKPPGVECRRPAGRGPMSTPLRCAAASHLSTRPLVLGGGTGRGGHPHSPTLEPTHPARAASTAAHQRAFSGSGKNEPVKLFFASCSTSSSANASAAATASKFAFM